MWPRHKNKNNCFIFQTSCFVFPLLQEKMKPRYVASWSRGERTYKTKGKIHLQHPDVVSNSFIPLICRRKTVTPRYCRNIGFLKWKKNTYNLKQPSTIVEGDLQHRIPFLSSWRWLMPLTPSQRSPGLLLPRRRHPVENLPSCRITTCLSSSAETRDLWYFPGLQTEEISLDYVRISWNPSNWNIY